MILNVIILNPINITKSQYVSTCLPTIDHIDPPRYATEIHWGKGFLAADESGGPWLRARHAEAAKIPDTASLGRWSGPERVDEKSQLNRHEQWFENNIRDPG